MRAFVAAAVDSSDGDRAARPRLRLARARVSAAAPDEVRVFNGAHASELNTSCAIRPSAP